MNQFKLVSVYEVKELYPFLKEYKSYNRYEDWLDIDYFLVSKGDIEINDHFYLDMYEEVHREKYKVDSTENINIEGIYIGGDLIVNGCIINEIGDYGPFVYVEGNIKCQSLLLGGACVIARQDIHVEEIVLTNYNHGYFFCNGTIYTPIFIVTDHDTYVEKCNVSLFYYHDNDMQSEKELEHFDEISGMYICSDDLLKYLDSPLPLTIDELIQDLAEGEYILKGQQKTIRDYQYWYKKIIKNPQSLRRVPEEFLTKELCEQALSISYNVLPLVPKKFISTDLCCRLVKKDSYVLRFIPDEYKTFELCQLAAKEGTLLIYIPKKFYSEELIITTFTNAKYEPDINDVPKEFITENILIEYVKIGRGLWLDKVCKENNINKLHIIEKVINGGIDYLDVIFNYHCSREAFNYAKILYNLPEYEDKWNFYLQKYSHKLIRLECI